MPRRRLEGVDVFSLVCVCVFPSVNFCVLTHLPLDKMTAISQTIFSDVISWMKSFLILIKNSLKFVPKGQAFLQEIVKITWMEYWSTQYIWLVALKCNLSGTTNLRNLVINHKDVCKRK